MKTRSYQFGKSRLTIEFGDITSAKTQVIVSSDDYYITMGGGVSASILRAGGQEIMIDAAKKVPAKLGEVVVTTAGRLQAQYVFHAITIEQHADRDRTSARQVVRDVVGRCFDLLGALGLESIAFPSIGAGVAGFPYDVVAAEMAHVVAARLTRTDRPIDVTLFLFDRFGRMQDIDFIRFFEEFARREPGIAARELGELAGPATEQARAQDVKPAAPVARQLDLRLKLNELTEERAALEERLAGAAGMDAGKTQTASNRLAEISDERIRILSELQHGKAEPVSVFISYSHKDRELREELEKHLAILRRNGFIRIWHDRMIAAGTEWRGVIDENLRSASLILLLVSPDFMASDYCYDVELDCALRRHEAREARVIPIILRQVMWDKAPFSKLQALPAEGKPAKSWESLDSALDNVAWGIRAVIESMRAGNQP